MNDRIKRDADIDGIFAHNVAPPKLPEKLTVEQEEESYRSANIIVKTLFPQEIPDTPQELHKMNERRLAMIGSLLINNLATELFDSDNMVPKTLKSEDMNGLISRASNLQKIIRVAAGMAPTPKAFSEHETKSAEVNYNMDKLTNKERTDLLLLLGKAKDD